MCTAVSHRNGDHYFGRNLDLEYSYNEQITITPRNFPFRFRKMPDLLTHYAIIGMAYVADDFPLYYEATNEKGVSIAGLNFPGFAQYYCEDAERDNIAPFELIPWLLGQCENLAQVRKKLESINLVKIDFRHDLPLSPLHWLIADRDESIVLECTKDGMKVFDNPVGVLTNNPPFDYQLFNLNNYMHVTSQKPVNRFSSQLDLSQYSLGMGGIGLPGDLSSMSRFVKVAFTKINSLSDVTEEQNVSQFFHILASVEQQRGCTLVRDGEYEFTLYSCCCNTDKGIYYYRTYDNSQISCIDMHRENLEAATLVSYPLLKAPQIYRQN